MTGYLVARDATLTMAPLEAQQSRAELGALMALWRSNLDAPLPVACKTALALLQGGDPRAVYEGGFEQSGEGDDLCLARLWPDFAALVAGGDWAATSQALYGPLAAWLEHGVALAPHQSEEPL